MAHFVVAVDGPAGSGKSSVSREVARRLGFDYLDTGAGYRAFTFHAMQHPDLDLAGLIASFDYAIETNPENPRATLSSVDISTAIRSAQVAGRVSEFASKAEVRALQLEDARKRIAASLAPGIVVEGRDITTAVAPDAQVRVLLTASEEVRLARRAGEQTEDVQNLSRRDSSDSKVVDFFNPASGVSLIDTTELDFEQSVAALIEKIREVQDGRG